MIKGRVTARPALSGKVVGHVIADGGYDRGFAEGKQEEYDRFWDAFQQNGTRTNYEYAFRYWADETVYKPKYIPKPINNAKCIFEDAVIPRIDLTNFDATELITGGTMAFSSNYIEYLEMDIPKCTALASSMYYMRGLKTLKLYNMNQCLLGTLIQANVLENVEFTGTFGGEYFHLDASNLLTYESIQNIIESAYDYGANPDGNTHNLKFHATVKKKLTEADIAKLTQKGWTLI